MIQRLILIAVTGAALLPAQTPARAASTGPTFATPEEARDALIATAKKGMDAVRTFFGAGSGAVAGTGDEVEDKALLERFNRLAAEKAVLEEDPVSVDQMTLLIGDIGWPFAVPLVKKNGRWSYDLVEGKAELRRRVIGGNELDVIQICRGFVEAQEEYARTDWDGNGVLEYASKILSSPGKKDGLYWPGEDSPVAAGFAKAVAHGYAPAAAGSAPRPYHGYYFKVLMAQGPDAAGGELDYLAHNLMIGGYALVAWPAEYGVSGIKTFIVNQDGVVYEKDLGPTTGTVAKAMTKFNPDKSWQASPDDDDQ
jgi:hypothetical protein